MLCAQTVPRVAVSIFISKFWDSRNFQKISQVLSSVLTPCKFHLKCTLPSNSRHLHPRPLNQALGILPITPLTPAECGRNRLHEHNNNHTRPTLATVECPQVCVGILPLEHIPLVECPLVAARAVKSPALCLSCLLDVNRWVRE